MRNDAGLTGRLVEGVELFLNNGYIFQGEQAGFADCLDVDMRDRSNQS